MPTNAEQSYQEDLLRSAMQRAAISQQADAARAAAQAAMYGADRGLQGTQYAADTGLKGINATQAGETLRRGTAEQNFGYTKQLEGDFNQRAQAAKELAAQAQTSAQKVASINVGPEQARADLATALASGDIAKAKLIASMINESAGTVGSAPATGTPGAPMAPNPYRERIFNSVFPDQAAAATAAGDREVALAIKKQAAANLSSSDPTVRGAAEKFFSTQGIQVPTGGFAPANPLNIEQRDPEIQRAVQQVSDLARRYGIGNYAAGGTRYIPDSELPGGVPSDAEVESAARKLYLQLSDRMRPDQAAAIVQDALGKSLMTKPEGGFAMNLFGDNQEKAKEILKRITAGMTPGMKQ